jgi:hypothetical protein
MTAKLKLKTYHNLKALVVPFNVLILNDEREYSVNVLTGKHSYEQRDIKIRQSLTDGVEVSEGVKVGEKLLIQE